MHAWLVMVCILIKLLPDFIDAVTKPRFVVAFVDLAISIDAANLTNQT